jgi:FPC/CPF motif-containing protein YcgG
LPHGEALPAPKRPKLGNLGCDEVMDWREESSHEDEEYTPPASCPHLRTQQKLNDLIENVNLFKVKAEILVSRL